MPVGPADAGRVPYRDRVPSNEGRTRPDVRLKSGFEYTGGREYCNSPILPDELTPWSWVTGGDITGVS